MHEKTNSTPLVPCTNTHSRIHVSFGRQASQGSDLALCVLAAIRGAQGIAFRETSFACRKRDSGFLIPKQEQVVGLFFDRLSLLFTIWVAYNLYSITVARCYSLRNQRHYNRFDYILAFQCYIQKVKAFIS